MSGDEQHHRLTGEIAPGTITDGDASTTPEALKVLETRGVDAWRVYVAAQQKGGSGAAD
jgi:hypothetical protein